MKKQSHSLTAVMWSSFPELYLQELGFPKIISDPEHFSHQNCISSVKIDLDICS